jgi:hypothetical protein
VVRLLKDIGSHDEHARAMVAHARAVVPGVGGGHQSRLLPNWRRDPQVADLDVVLGVEQQIVGLDALDRHDLCLVAQRHEDLAKRSPVLLTKAVCVPMRANWLGSLSATKEGREMEEARDGTAARYSWLSWSDDSTSGDEEDGEEEEGHDWPSFLGYQDHDEEEDDDEDEDEEDEEDEDAAQRGRRQQRREERRRRQVLRQRPQEFWDRHFGLPPPPTDHQGTPPHLFYFILFYFSYIILGTKLFF